MASQQGHAQVSEQRAFEIDLPRTPEERETLRAAERLSRAHQELNAWRTRMRAAQRTRRQVAQDAGQEEEQEYMQERRQGPRNMLRGRRRSHDPMNEYLRRHDAEINRQRYRYASNAFDASDASDASSPLVFDFSDSQQQQQNSLQHALHNSLESLRSQRTKTLIQKQQEQNEQQERQERQEQQERQERRGNLYQSEKTQKFKRQAKKFTANLTIEQEIPEELRQAYFYYLLMYKTNKACSIPFAADFKRHVELKLRISNLIDPFASFDLIANVAYKYDLLNNYTHLYVIDLSSPAIDYGGVTRSVFANVGKYIMQQYMVENLSSHVYKFKYNVPLSAVRNIAIVMTYALFMEMPLGIPFSAGIIYLLIRGITQKAELLEDDEYLGTLLYLESINSSHTDPFYNVRQGIKLYYSHTNQVEEATIENYLFSFKRFLENNVFYGNAIYNNDPAQAINLQQPLVKDQQTNKHKINQQKLEQLKSRVDKKLNRLFRAFIFGVTSSNPPLRKCLSIKDIQSRLGVKLTKERMLAIPIHANNPYVQYYIDFVDKTNEGDWKAFLEFVTGVAFPPTEEIKFHIAPLYIHSQDLWQNEIIRAHTCDMSLDIPNKYPIYSKENSDAFRVKLLQHIHSVDAIGLSFA